MPDWTYAQYPSMTLLWSVARTAFLHDAETMLLGETALSPVYFDGTAHMLRDTLRGVYTDGFGNSYFAGVRANTD